MDATRNGSRAASESLDIIAAETAGRPDAAIAYAATESYLNNSLKNGQGMLAGFAHSDSVARKKALEAEFAAWIAADPSARPPGAAP